MTEMTDAEVFTEAAQLIDTFGWQQGSNGTRGEGFCAAGAMIAALGLPPNFDYTSHPVVGARWHRLVWKAQDELHRRERTSSLTGWNDQAHRKADEVIAFLREMAEMSSHADS